MNRISLIMNIILSIAVAVLFYLHFSSKPQAVSTSGSEMNVKNDSLAKTISTTQAQTESRIVYLNIDTLKEKYDWFREVKTKYETSLNQLDQTIAAKYESLQNDYNAYIESQGAGLTKDQMIAKETDFQNRKAEIEKMQQSKGLKEEEGAKKLDEVQKKLNEFFNAFTKEHGYSCILIYTVNGEGALGVDPSLDVTDPIIKGLNEQYHKEHPEAPKKK